MGLIASRLARSPLTPDEYYMIYITCMARAENVRTGPHLMVEPNGGSL